MTGAVPALPSVPAALERRHGDVHDALAHSVAGATPEARRVFVAVQGRLLVEALGYVQPVLARPAAPLVFPPRRGFLTRTQELRIMGAAAAFRHLDARVTMVGSGAIPAAVTGSTPLALHALLEGHLPEARETNAGMYRVTPTRWRPSASTFAHPPAEIVEDLVGEAVAVATSDAAPAFVRAGWLTFTMLSIHPFVDGNGRTSRALYLGIAGPALGLGVDWGVLEQWALARSAYVAALQAGQAVPAYSGPDLDAGPFVTFSAEASVVGAELARRRLEAIETDLAGLELAGVSPAARVACVGIRINGFTDPDDLRELGLDGPAATDAVAELIARGAVQWAPRPAARRTAERRSSSGLVVAGA